MSIGHQSVIMDALGIDVPAEYGRGVAARGISVLRKALSEQGSIETIDDEIKRKWMATLIHNRYDCFGMAAIMCPVTRGRGHTLLQSKWVMDPHQKPVQRWNRLEEVRHPNPPDLMYTFASAWEGYDFFYGATYTNQGWAIAGFSDFDTGFQLIVPLQTADSLQAALDRAEIENLAEGRTPNYDWRESIRWSQDPSS